MAFINRDEGITAHNLATNEYICFDSNTTPLYAVVYGYCLDNSLASQLFDHIGRQTFLEYARTLPVNFGRETVACGDWCALLGNFEKQDFGF